MSGVRCSYGDRKWREASQAIKDVLQNERPVFLTMTTRQLNDLENQVQVNDWSLTPIFHHHTLKVIKLMRNNPDN